MNRFSGRKGRRIPGGFAVITAELTLGILLLSQAAVSGIDRDARRRERENLERVLEQSVTLCYALEGSYPESLDYLRNHYGIRWDEERFLVDFEPVGSNLPPDVTVLAR